jgi:hypothetical protein
MEILGIGALVLSTCLSLLLVPDITPANWYEPTILAGVGTPLVLATLVGWRIERAPVAWERMLLAAFLFLMPTVYLSSLALHGGSRDWLTTEVIGQALFATIALIGWRVPWVLAVGLASHGLGWDSWHHGRTQFIPDWYTIACLMVDVGYGVYALSRLPAWNADVAPAATRVRAQGA